MKQWMTSSPSPTPCDPQKPLASGLQLLALPSLPPDFSQAIARYDELAVAYFSVSVQQAFPSPGIIGARERVAEWVYHLYDDLCQ